MIRLLPCEGALPNDPRGLGAVITALIEAEAVLAAPNRDPTGSQTMTQTLLIAAAGVLRGHRGRTVDTYSFDRQEWQAAGLHGGSEYRQIGAIGGSGMGRRRASAASPCSETPAASPARTTRRPYRCSIHRRTAVAGRTPWTDSGRFSPIPMGGCAGTVVRRRPAGEALTIAVPAPGTNSWPNRDG